MRFSKKEAISIICLSAFLFCIFMGGIAVAEKLTFQTRLNIQGEYFDNVTFERLNPQEDYLMSIEPSFSLGYQTEKFDLGSRAWFDLGRYANETVKDQENQEYSINANYRFSERTSINGGFSYRRDSTQDTQLLETGEIAPFQDRIQYSGQGGIYFSFSELTSIGLNYNYLKREYSESYGTDYEQNSISLSFNRNFNDGLDTLTFQPTYYRQTMDYGELDYYSASIGWTHRVSERFQINAYLGGRKEKQKYGDLELDSDGIIANISIQRSYIGGAFSLGYNQDLHREVGGGQTEVKRLFCQVDKQVLPRFGMGFYGSIYHRKEPSGPSDDYTIYYEVRPRLYYMLTEKQVLEMGYSYANSYDSTFTQDRSVERNAIWIALKLVYDNIL